MDIIPIQASSVPCERVFSSGKQTMTPRRGHISGHLMECLQILKFSIRKGRPLRFTEGMSWTDELLGFEMAARTAPLGDAEAYRRSLETTEDDLDDLENDIRKELEELEEDLVLQESESGNEDEGSDDIYATD
jgi:hypothetical protein